MSSTCIDNVSGDAGDDDDADAAAEAALPHTHMRENRRRILCIIR